MLNTFRSKTTANFLMAMKLDYYLGYQKKEGPCLPKTDSIEAVPLFLFTCATYLFGLEQGFSYFSAKFVYLLSTFFFLFWLSLSLSFCFFFFCFHCILIHLNAAHQNIFCMSLGIWLWTLSPGHFPMCTQISIRNIVHCLRCIVSGKSFILPSVTWTSDTKKRLCVLFLTTIGLLFARFKVMGSQLPVFTRYVWCYNYENFAF